MPGPRSIEAVANELRTALRSGTLAVAELEAHVAALPDSTFEGWAFKFVAGAKGPDPLRPLIHAVLNEATGLRQGADAEALAILATTTAGAFADVDQLALARRAQARAYDRIDRIADRERQDALAVLLAIHDTEIARRGQDFDAAAAALPDIEALSRELPETEHVSLKLAQRASVALLRHRQGHLETALQLFTETNTLADEVTAELAMGTLPAHLTHMIQSTVSKFYNGYSNALSSAVSELEAGCASAALDALLQQNAQHWAATIEARTLSHESSRLEPAARLAKENRVLCLALLDTAIDHAESIHSYEFLGTQHYNAGCVLDELGLRSAALERMAKATNYARRVPGHPTATKIAIYLANDASRSGDGPAALEHWRAAISNEMRRLLEHAGQKGEYSEAELIDGVLTTTLQGADPCQAIVLVESLKGLAFARTVAQGIPDFDLDTALSHDLRMLHSRRETLRCAIEAGMAPGAELSAVEDEFERVQGELRIRSPELSHWTNAFGVEPARIDHLRAALRNLGPGTVLLGSEGARAEKIWVYAVTADDVVIEHVPRPERGADSAALGVALFSPLASILERLVPSERIVFTGSPRLPLASMLFRGKPLCECATISFVKSVSVLLALQQRQPIALNVGVFVGDPARPGERLRGAAREATTLAAMFEPTGTSLIDEDATIRRLQQHLNCDILHIAAHASAAGEDGCRSGTVWLAPDDAGDSGALSEDRVLSELALREGAFVNLATCVSAAQRDRPGFLDGGLVNAFFAVGARSVLATKERINDHAAATFQLEFYRRLEAGATPATSLVETQRACLRGELGRALLDPKLWDAFQLFGI